MSTVTAASPARPAGRPRDERIDVAILEATLALLADRGYQSLSIAAVAEAAGVGKPAIHRRYGSKAELVVAAVDILADEPEPELPDGTREALAELLEATAAVIGSPGGLAIMGSLLAAGAMTLGSRTSHVDARDVAAVIARALTEAGHEGRARTPTGPAALTYDECAAILSDVLGRPIRYAEPAPWSYWRRTRRVGMPRAMAAVTIGIYTAARLDLAAGITDDVARITGCEPIDFATFARDHAAAWCRARDGIAA